MPWPVKPLVKRVCNYCFKEKWMKRAKARRFRYCSNKCKWAAKRNSTSKQKMPIQKKQAVKCTSVFCNNVRYYFPRHIKRVKQKFCSRKCYYYYRSTKYKLDLEQLKKQKSENLTRQIWRL